MKLFFLFRSVCFSFHGSKKWFENVNIVLISRAKIAEILNLETQSFCQKIQDSNYVRPMMSNHLKISNNNINCFTTKNNTIKFRK